MWYKNRSIQLKKSFRIKEYTTIIVVEINARLKTKLQEGNLWFYTKIQTTEKWQIPNIYALFVKFFKANNKSLKYPDPFQNIQLIYPINFYLWSK